MPPVRGYPHQCFLEVGSSSYFLPFDADVRALHFGDVVALSQSIGHIEESSQFVLWLQQQLESWNGSAEVMGNHWAELAQSYTTMSDEVKRFEEISVNQNFKTWWSKAELCPVKKLMASSNITTATPQPNSTQVYPWQGVTAPCQCPLDFGSSSS